MIGVRISGLMLFAPFFGNGANSASYQGDSGHSHHGRVYPAYFAQVGIVTLAQWPGVVAREFVLGVAIGVVTNFVFEAAQLAWSSVGVQWDIRWSTFSIRKPRWTPPW